MFDADSMRDQLKGVLHDGYICKAEMARQIGVGMCTLLRILDENNQRDWSMKTRNGIKNFLKRYQEEN
jgi:hypothetical protein